MSCRPQGPKTRFNSEFDTHCSAVSPSIPTCQATHIKCGQLTEELVFLGLSLINFRLHYFLAHNFVHIKKKQVMRQSRKM